MNVRIRYEQAVYGSFPFWDRGYGLLGHSPGCRPEWLDWLRSISPRIGPPPAGASRGGLHALRPDRATWAILGVFDQGADDHGRPGAVAFHALFLSRDDYHKLGADPFRLRERLRPDWGPDDRVLPAVVLDLEAPREDTREGPGDARAEALAQAIARGGRVTVSAQGPIDDLARDVWRALPRRRRRRATLSTWTNDRTIGRDLAAGPFPTHVAWPRPRAWVLVLASVLAVLLVSPLVIVLRNVPADPTPAPGPTVAPDPRIATFARLPRYEGPWLTAAERAELAGDDDPEARRALLWDALLRRFAADRPLPGDFDELPRAERVRLLAWSFHLDVGAGASEDETLRRLGEALTIDVATRPSPLADRHPALDDYARFLARLPRRHVGETPRGDRPLVPEGRSAYSGKAAGDVDRP